MDKKETNTLMHYGTTDAQIEDWKLLWGKDQVMKCELPLDDNGDAFLGAVLKAPDRKVLGEFEKWSDKNPDKAKEIMINGCFLTRKDEVKANAGLFAGAFDACAQLIPIRRAILKN
ncbi:hypothetical protein BDD43_3393 [Mucilaginibacter gracilis]|uniref:Uncharacterized protein n=1 Tax=Mucilaginibacter gracilis TaxID=423350 RepID=A0A495J3E2_9SPHI|nr:hypothetical protein [Mucilaginibacter gracilis]RKR83191.1 hypothetical protein BDD43_3393 [Mucilaginibacter gracilis]